MFTKQQFEISLLLFSHKFLSNLIVFKVLNVTGEPWFLRAGADHGSGTFRKPSSTFPDTSVDSSLAWPFIHPQYYFIFLPLNLFSLASYLFLHLQLPSVDIFLICFFKIDFYFRLGWFNGSRCLLNTSDSMSCSHPLTFYWKCLFFSELPPWSFAYASQLSMWHSNSPV